MESKESTKKRGVENKNLFLSLLLLPRTNDTDIDRSIICSLANNALISIAMVPNQSRTKKKFEGFIRNSSMHPQPYIVICIHYNIDPNIDKY